MVLRNAPKPLNWNRLVALQCRTVATSGAFGSPWCMIALSPIMSHRGMG
jgi:hypothetical protein